LSDSSCEGGGEFAGKPKSEFHHGALPKKQLKREFWPKTSILAQKVRNPTTKTSDQILEPLGYGEASIDEMVTDE
jgi:hypothetical protein